MRIFDDEDDLQPVDGEQPEGGEQQPEGGPTKADPIADVAKRLDSLENELREAKEDTKYWREQATTGGGRRQAAEPEPEEEEDPEISISEDIVEAVSSGDPKRFAKLVRDVAKQSGMVDTKTVQKMIAQTATDMVKRETIYTQFPDLKDTNSDLFKLTDKHYRRMAQRLGSESVELIEEAAQRAALELGVEAETAAPRSRRASSREEDDEYEYETRRQRRVSQQAAPASRRGRAEGDEELNQGQSRLIAKLQSIGAPITVQGYKERARKGINYSGLPSRRVK